MQLIETQQETEKQKLLIEQGKFKELYETNAAKVSEYEKELEELRALKTQITEQKEKERKELIKNLPKELKDIIDDSDSVEKIMKLKASFETATKPNPTSPLVASGTTIPTKTNKSESDSIMDLLRAAPVLQ